MDISKLHAEFNEACQQNEIRIDEIHLSYKLNREIPRELYHYTNIKGLYGILSTQTIRATSVEYLNDKTEVEHGLQLAQQAIDEAAKKYSVEKNFPCYILLSNISYELRKHRTSSNYFVSCFCEQPDLLSQWRAYGQSGGFSLDFDPVQLEYSIRRLNANAGGLLDPATQRACYFEGVIYDLDTQNSLISSVLASCIEAFEFILNENSISKEIFMDLLKKSDRSDEKAFGECFSRFSKYSAKKLIRFLTTFKHPAFAEEKEWRMVHRRAFEDSDNLKFRIGKGYLIPFVELKFDASLSFNSITCGPPATDLSTLSLKSFLKSLKLGDKRIFGTTAPLR